MRKGGVGCPLAGQCQALPTRWALKPYTQQAGELGTERRQVHAAAAKAVTATGGRPRERRTECPPGRGPAPACLLLPKPQLQLGSSGDPPPAHPALQPPQLRRQWSAPAPLERAPQHTGSFQQPRVPPCAPGSVRRPQLPPWSARLRARLSAPRRSRGARPPCTLEHRATSFCQLLWILAAVSSGCLACPPGAGRWGGGWL